MPASTCPARRRSALRSAALALSFLVLPLSGTSSAAAWGNLQLNQDATTELQNEEQIAINPTDPDNMVAVWRDFRLGFRQVGWAYTFDGGVSWTEGGLIDEPNYPWQSDPGVTADRDGNFYAVLLSLVSTSQPNGIYVVKSTDGGMSWGAPLEVVNGVPDVFEDKELLACDRTAGPHSGNLYVAWTRFPNAGNPQIVFRRSTDGGAVWSSTLDLTGGAAPLVQFPIPVIGRQGEVYVAWSRQNIFSQIKLKVSTDGGVTFGSGRTVVNTQGVFHSLNGGVDAYSSPHMDADITDGPFSGRVYVAFMDRRSGLGDFDIWVTASDDSGATWSAPVRVNDDVPDNGRDQFHPWLTVDNLGIVTVVYLGRRHDPANLTYHCMLTQSADGGMTWTPSTRVSTAPSDPTFAFSPPDGPADAPVRDGLRAGLIGEYIGVVSWSGHPTPVWTDIRNLQQDVFAGYRPGGVGIDPTSTVPIGAGLAVAPNPVRPGRGTVVRADGSGAATLRIFDLSGRLVRELTGSSSADGPVTIRWDGSRGDGRPAAAGVYFLRLDRGSGRRTGRVVVVE
jgi:hypothetical protein